jgi:serine protease Do
MRKLLVLSSLLMSSGLSIGQESVADVVKRSSNAVVLIVISDSNGQETALGSGFFASANGEIVTNFHVIEDADSAMVKISTGAIFPVSGMLASDPDRDLAIIKINGKNLPFLTLGNDDTLQVGNHVVAIGSPLGLEGTVSDGIVSSMRKSDGKKWIQTTAPASHGNSGGPLLDMRGTVVGVISAGPRAGPKS